MKTIIIMARLLCSFVLLNIFHAADTQTVISFDATPDNIMIMKIQDPNLTDKPDKLILIFDSATLTCEFSEKGVIALHTTQYRKGCSGVTSSYSYIISEEPNGSRNLSQERNEKEYLPDSVQREDPLTLEDWMLRPAEWKSPTNL